MKNAFIKLNMTIQGKQLTAVVYISDLFIILFNPWRQPKVIVFAFTDITLTPNITIQQKSICQ